MPRVDRAAPLEFLRIALEADDWIAVLLKSYETGQTIQRVGPVSMIAASRFQAWLRSQNARRFNVYVSVNAITPGRRSRTREAIGAVRHLFLEVDRDGVRTMAALAERTDLPPPSYVLHSSPNRIHVFWRVRGFSKTRIEALQKQLARELDADPAATSVAQMTRLPGFYNHKYKPPALVKVEYRASQFRYRPDDLPAPAPTPARTWPGPARRVAPVRSLERARRYLNAVPPAVAGEHGDLRTFKICCHLVRGFDLGDADALALLAVWNSHCAPPWSEVDLLDKLRRARRYGRDPIGGLLD